MNDYDLSICIPSKKNYLESKDSISSAIGFCESTKSQLHISDNSEDKDKEEVWSNLRLENLNYIKADKMTATENWYNSVKDADGKYIGICADDDLLVNISKSEVEYFSISDEIIAIKPTIQLWTNNRGIYNINNFSLTQLSAIDRLNAYISNCNGNNTTLYSFFKGKVFIDLLEASLSHPIQAGSEDCSFVLALVSSGQVLLDPSKLYIYKNTNWLGTSKEIDNEHKKLYQKVGISERALYFSRLFRALDGLIYIMRKTTPISRIEAVAAGKFIFGINIKLFIEEFCSKKNLYTDSEKYNIHKIKPDFNIEKKLDLVIEILQSFNQDIAKKYVNFYEKVTGNKWGVIK